MATLEGAVGVQEEKKGDILILHLKGKLDAISSPLTEKKIFDCINNGQHKLLLDFAGVDYLSSAGMRMLLSTTKKLKALSGKLVLCSITPNVMDVLVMSGFDHVLELAKNVDEAIKKFNGI